LCILSLDASSSGPQIIALLLRNLKLAKLVQLSNITTQDNQKEPDWYTTISNHLTEEIIDVFLKLKVLFELNFNFLTENPKGFGETIIKNLNENLNKKLILIMIFI
jgi:hypothetical protein